MFFSLIFLLPLALDLYISLLPHPHPTLSGTNQIKLCVVYFYFYFFQAKSRLYIGSFAGNRLSNSSCPYILSLRSEKIDSKSLKNQFFPTSFQKPFKNNFGSSRTQISLKSKSLQKMIKTVPVYLLQSFSSDLNNNNNYYSNAFLLHRHSYHHYFSLPNPSRFI